MATHRIPILGAGTIPDASGNVYFEPFSIHATGDVWKRLVVVFKDTATRIGLRGGFVVPKNYVSAPKIVVVWTTAATTGNCVWDFDYRAVGGNDTESLDDTVQESVSVTDAAPGATFRRLEALLTLTATNLAADDEVEFEVFRDGLDANDTLADEALLFELLFEYTDV